MPTPIVEAVQHDIGDQHDRDQPEPDESHLYPSRNCHELSAVAPRLTAGRGRALADGAIDQNNEQNRQHGVHAHESQQGEQVLPADTFLEYPSEVRIRP